ncbi:hypothetical protein [Cyanothece sp. BG0011]|uniref:hypothetical protein n=1 Tax=Cyanothece sp. BG0011 TaxID=2082950 RepID=UPI000D1DEC02|nr:hypothetical protein [Cyanothece sp. BG0011]
MTRLHTEEEHRIIVPAYYHHNEEKNDKPNFKQLLNSWKGILGIAATLATILAVIFPAYQAWSERPNLNVATQALELRPDKTIIQILDELEEGYTEVTGGIIWDLRRNIEILLEEILKIKIPEMGESDSRMNEIKINTSSLEEEYINQINKYIKTAIDNIQKEKEIYDSESSEEVKKLKKVEDKLSDLAKLVDKKSNDINEKRIVLDLLIENHSNLQNGIRETAVVRFYKNKEVHFPITLKLKHNHYEDIVIDGNSFKLFKFESSLIDAFSKDEREFIKSAFDNQYSYIFALEDIKSNIWSEEGTILNFNLDSQSDKLKQKTEVLLNKKDAWSIPWR